jgi:hypothetical protein
MTHKHLNTHSAVTADAGCTHQQVRNVSKVNSATACGAVLLGMVAVTDACQLPLQVLVGQ